MPLKPHDYAPRDEAILAFIKTYVIALYCCLEKLYFATGNCGSAAKRLSTANPHETKAPLVQIRSKSLPKCRSYLQLSLAGCRHFAVSVSHAAPLRSAALDLAIAIQWACVFGIAEMHRVAHQEIVALLGKDAPANNVPHVIACLGETGEPRLLRVYHALSDLQTCIHHLSELAAAASHRPLLSKWLSTQDYGFLVLCPTQASCNAMRSALHSRGLSETFTFHVELGPMADTLDEALRGLKS